MFLTAIFTK